MYVNEEFKKLVIILNNRIKKQNDLQQEYEPHTKEYQTSLKEEIKLLEEKKHLIDEETKRLDAEKKGYVGDFGSDKIKIPRLKSYEETILEVLYGIKQELTEIKGYVKKEDKVTTSDLFNDIQKGLIKKHQENMSKFDSSLNETETIINKKQKDQDEKDIKRDNDKQGDKVKEYKVIRITFENCESILIPAQDIVFMRVNNLNQHIRKAWRSEVKFSFSNHCSGVMINIKNNEKYKRLMEYNDITIIRIFEDEDLNREKSLSFYVPWGQGEWDNENQISKIEDGLIKIKIEESKG